MHSLISPSDRRNLKEVNEITLEQMNEIKKIKLKDITFLQEDRYYADPNQMNQLLSLVSFVPSKGAKPDEDGIYGMMKVRGVYATEEEANERAEFLIRNVDSYHEIYHAYVGRPFPITTSDKYAADIKKIDIRKKTTDIISEDILEKKREERQEMMTMKDREKMLLEESKKAQRNEPKDIFEEYITENVKRAQLVWTYHETLKKMKQMQESFENATNRIKEIDNLHPDYVDKYMESLIIRAIVVLHHSHSKDVL